VRRRLPGRHHFPRLVAEPPIRVLLVSPRPEDDATGYIDHRIIAEPLVQALGELGDLAEVHVLSPPTLPALEGALQAAQERGEPFHVVHFDGHGVFDRRLGLGALCFEDPRDVDKAQKRRHVTIPANEVAAILRERRIPLVFLNACQSARAEEDPTASVAACLLDEGVASVVAMSYSVLVETARRFVSAFYRALVGGATVGQAILKGQQALHRDASRGTVFGGRDLHLQDWFVPVLLQEEEDVQLFRQIPSEQIAGEVARARRLRLGELPRKEGLAFVGRSRELLALERMLQRERWVAVIGQGGEGKTTLAVELADWLVRSQRFQRAAFVSLEKLPDARAVADSIGRQLLPKYSVAHYAEADLLGEALSPIVRALEEEPTVIVVDNVESVLDEPGGLDDPQGLGGLFTRLLDCDRNTRILFTSREGLSQPFAPGKDRYLQLGRLSRDEAIKLVERHMPEPPPPDDAGRIEDLVEAVQGHARSLVLLAPEICRRGVTVTTATLGRLLAQLHEAYPDDRERSLYASVALSLQRLSPETRQMIRPLGVFQGEVTLAVLAMILEVEKKELVPVVRALLETNLAEPKPYDHLRLHPALCPYLARELADQEREELTRRWVAGMVGLTNHLCRRLFRDTRVASTLTRLELPNLLHLLETLAGQGDAGTTLRVATRVELLLAELDHPRLLQRVVAIREEASRQSGGGLTDVQFEGRRMEIERLLQSGQLPQAHQAAQSLLTESQYVASEVSAYNQVMAFALVGRVLFAGGIAGEALFYLQEAQSRFEQVGQAGARMASVTLTEKGNCLLVLGRLEEAAQAYERAVELDEQHGRTRDVAVGKGQLATVRTLQGRHDEAIAGHQSAKELFLELAEPRMVATAWHQIGVAHQEAGEFEAAEEAYREGLALMTGLGDRTGEAATLDQLGNLCDRMDRQEEAATLHRQAADICAQIGDRASEGRARNNLAFRLIKLDRYDEARIEILRAIACGRPYGHATEPWKAWNVLDRLEQAVGNQSAAAEARAEARRLFLAYRRDGGENHTPGGRLCAAFLQALQSGQTARMASGLRQLLGDPRWQFDEAQALISALQAILHDSRDPALAENPVLSYDLAAEVQLVLEALGG
jgi:tetratricopeptide (TPR) repeat protein